MFALKAAMIENQDQYSDKSLSIRQIFGEGDMIATHSLLHVVPDDNGFNVVHMFRFENGKIAEMWDCIQPLEINSSNPAGPF